MRMRTVRLQQINYLHRADLFFLLLTENAMISLLDAATNDLAQL